MQPVLTPEAMGAADRAAIAAGTPESVLMDRAGRAVALAIRRRIGGTYGVRAVVVCGKGNNGGDGHIAARAMRAWGARVDVLTLDAGVDGGALERALARADVAVDAMFGTGFRGELAGDAAEVVDAFASFPGLVVSIDVPSGVDGLTGLTRGPAVCADVTVTFAAVKPGLCFEPGRTLAGTVEVADIGIAVVEPGRLPPTFLTEADDVAAWLPPRAPDAHKWASGLFVVGGSGGMTGAPALASHAAMRAGAGIVWCGVPGAEAAARAGGSEVISHALPLAFEGGLARGAAEVVLRELDRFRALAVGPGLGRADDTVVVVRHLVADAPIPLVLDADALHAVAGDLAVLRARVAPTVLTPHAGEYAALRSEPVGDDRLAAARALAADTGAVVLLKGPGTVVAAPDGRAAICPTGGAWLATAGTGDVLTGIVGAFLARGLDAFEAAAAAAFVHGAAADRAGHTGLVAGDLVGSIPAVLDSL